MPIETLHDMTLKELRQLKGLHQTDIAKHTGYSRQALSNLEKGLTENPQRETIQSLADHFNESFAVVMRAVHNSIHRRKEESDDSDQN